MKHKVNLDGLSDALKELIANQEEEYWYGIHEVYYDEVGEVDGWTADEIQPFGETPEELKQCFELMSLAFDKEVLDYEKSYSTPDIIDTSELMDADKKWAMDAAKDCGLIE